MVVLQFAEGPAGFTVIPTPPAPPPPPPVPHPGCGPPPLFPCGGLVGGELPVPPPVNSVPPPPEPPGNPAVGAPHLIAPPPPPVLVIVENIESDPEAPLPDCAPAPPAPTVTDIGLAGIVNFVPEFNGAGPNADVL